MTNSEQAYLDNIAHLFARNDFAVEVTHQWIIVRFHGQSVTEDLCTPATYRECVTQVRESHQ